MKCQLCLITLILISFLSCEKSKYPFQNPDPLANIDTSALELMWEKPLDSNFQKIQIYPFPSGDNIIHTYDFGFYQILVYRNGKTGEEIKRINLSHLIYPTNGAIFNEKLIFGGIKSFGVLEPKTSIIEYPYSTVNPNVYINERFTMFNEFVLTNEYSIQPQDSMDRIIAINVKNNTSRVLFNEKNSLGKQILGKANLWANEVGDTILSIARSYQWNVTSPSNFTSFNISKNKVLYEMKISILRQGSDFICFNKKIYAVTYNNTVMCIDGNTGSLLWEYNGNGSKSITTLQIAVFDKQLIIVSSFYKTTLISLDIETGKALWTNSDIAFFNDNMKFLLIDNQLYFGKDDFIYGIDKNTGILLKKQQVTNGKNHLISNLSYSENNKLIYAIDSNFIKAFRIK